MKTITRSLMLLMLVSTLDTEAQNNAVTRIAQLDFPYRKGYHMHFKGTRKYDDQSQINPVTGKAKQVEVNSEMYYHIVDEKYVDGDTIAMFDLQAIHGEDTIHDDILSPLIVDPDGMYFWFDSEKKKELKKALGKNFAADINEEKVWALRTPLFDGKKWESYNYDYSAKNPYLCLTVDTLLQTYLGEMQAFGVTTQSIMQEEKDYYVVAQFTDYYAQKVGKIQTIQETYVVVKQTQEWILVDREEMTLDKTWWDEGYSDN